MIILVLLFLSVLLLTYFNGANDNFKGVATLWGSGTLEFRQALILATIFTLAGSVCSYFFAETLIKNFSGKGLVPDSLIQSKEFVLSVALGAGITVLLATKFGFPISTTHGLVGALIGAGLVGAGSAVNFGVLGKTFFTPLILSPIIAVVLSSIIYFIFKKVRQVAGVTAEDCICVGKKWIPVAIAQTHTGKFVSIQESSPIQVTAGNAENCQKQYQGKFLGITVQPLVNFLHYISAGLVSFARGLNDTPKLVSLLLICNFFNLPTNIWILAFVMAIGGWLNSKKVANTMSKKISSLNHGQGFSANLVTSCLVIAASKFGLPVSTTHVSVGSIYGIGIVNKTANKKEISKIGLSWLMTLPIASVISANVYFILIHINL
ncbi:MAG: inorganic phosphate transporter [Taibaiella sp.]|nr:inorganic phosphate transporter [Taibaiella sp.]